jgi:signal transduction histidine kinase
MVFHKLLNPGSPLGKARQVCLYPLAESLAKQALLRRQILGSGFLVLLVGLAASYALSLRLARPVEEIAADSAANQVGRQEAEAALELTADELKVVNKELVKALETLQATQQQVIEQERLRALGQMASGIAHDFNNALMPISGFSELLLANPDTDESTRRQYLEMIHTSARDAGSVVSRLREFYRPNEKTDVFGAVMLNRVVKQAATLTRPKWKDQAQANGADVRVRVELEDRMPVNADESALRELLTNLIFNAVDAMPSGGSLLMRTRCEADCGVIEVWAWRWSSASCNGIRVPSTSSPGWERAPSLSSASRSTKRMADAPRELRTSLPAIVCKSWWWMTSRKSGRWFPRF